MKPSLPDSQHKQPEIVVTGLGWLGVNARALDLVLRELIESAEHSLDITAYSITSEADEVLTALDKKLSTGVSTRIIIDNIFAGGQDTGDRNRKAWLRRRLRRMLEGNPHSLMVFDFPHISAGDGIHAKVLVADRSHALIGSANLSFRGFHSAHELDVLVHGEAARHAAECIDRLVQTARVRRWTGEEAPS